MAKRNSRECVHISCDDGSREVTVGDTFWRAEFLIDGTARLIKAEVSLIEVTHGRLYVILQDPYRMLVPIESTSFSGYQYRFTRRGAARWLRRQAQSLRDKALAQIHEANLLIEGIEEEA